ncbi:MAG: hypothetical protein ACP5VF_08800 [Acidobacteriota bacterium]
MARLERWLVILIALHSAAVGLFLVAAPEWSATTLGGWSQVAPIFFPRQAGVFHLVLAAGYLIEYFQYRGITLLVTAKCIATLFLLASTLAGGVPWIVSASGLGDGLMGISVILVRLRRTSSERGRSR